MGRNSARCFCHVDLSSFVSIQHLTICWICPDSRNSPNWSKSKKLRKRANWTEKSRCSSKEPWASQKEFWDEGLLYVCVCVRVCVCVCDLIYIAFITGTNQYQWLVHLDTVSPIMMYKNCATYFTKNCSFAQYYFTYVINMCIYIHTHEYEYMYSFNSPVYHDVRESSASLATCPAYFVCLEVQFFCFSVCSLWTPAATAAPLLLCSLRSLATAAPLAASAFFAAAASAAASSSTITVAFSCSTTVRRHAVSWVICTIISTLINACCITLTAQLA